MKLQQLRFLAAVAQNDLNLTAAASRVGATQPAVSKQLKLLEAELGFEIFVRKGRSLTRVTKMGRKVVAHALRMLHEVQGIKGISDDLRNAEQGTLSIGTTHTQARYVLPEVIRAFRQRYPLVNVHLHQGTSEQIAQMAAVDHVDLAIDSGSHVPVERYYSLPCHRWRLCVVVPEGHPLTAIERLRLEDLAGYPLVTYEFGVAEPTASLRDLFAAGGIRPNVSLTAWDSDVIKSYVRLGLGVGVVSEVAVEPDADTDLVYIDVRHLFPLNTTWVAFARGAVMRGFAYDFLSLLSPHLRRSLIEQAAACATQGEVDALLEGMRVRNWRASWRQRSRSRRSPTERMRGGWHRAGEQDEAAEQQPQERSAR